MCENEKLERIMPALINTVRCAKELLSDGVNTTREIQLYRAITIVHRVSKAADLPDDMWGI